MVLRFFPWIHCRADARTAQMAMTVLSIGPIIIAYPFFQKYFVKGIALGALKE